MRLFELARGDDDRTNFYQSTIDFANNWVEFTKSWETNYTPEVAKKESIELKEVAEAFLISLEKGAEKFYHLDTLIRDELAEHWEKDNLDPEKIYNIPRKIEPRKKATIIKGFGNWKAAILKKYPNAEIVIPDIEKETEKLKKLYPTAISAKVSDTIIAYIDDRSVGQFWPSSLSPEHKNAGSVK